MDNDRFGLLILFKTPLQVAFAFKVIFLKSGEMENGKRIKN